jgi:hypothetical protein
MISVKTPVIHPEHAGAKVNALGPSGNPRGSGADDPTQGGAARVLKLPTQSIERLSPLHYRSNSSYFIGFLEVIFDDDLKRRSGVVTVINDPNGGGRTR